MSPALGYLDLQLDLPRNEGPTAEATRLTDKRKPPGVSPCIWNQAAAKGHGPIQCSY